MSPYRRVTRPEQRLRAPPRVEPTLLDLALVLGFIAVVSLGALALSIATTSRPLSDGVWAAVFAAASIGGFVSCWRRRSADERGWP